MKGKLILIEFAAIAIVAIWGMTFISTKELLMKGISPTSIFFVRFVIAYIGLIIFQLFRYRILRKPFPLFCKDITGEALCALAGITGGSFYFWAENTALMYTQACNVSFIVCTTPLVTSLLYSAVRHEAPARHLLAGSAIALVGVGLIAFSGANSVHFSVRGDVLAMLASLTWAVYTLLSNKLLNNYSAGLVTRKVFFYGLITIIPLFVASGGIKELYYFKSALALGNILFLGLIASLFCYIVWNVIINKLGALKASNFIYLNPLFTLAGGIVILGERITILSALGCALTLLGVWASERKS